MPLILNLEAMAVKSKDIETLWKQYSEEGVNKGISVAQFFEISTGRRNDSGMGS